MKAFKEGIAVEKKEKITEGIPERILDRYSRETLREISEQILYRFPSKFLRKHLKPERVLEITKYQPLQI